MGRARADPIVAVAPGTVSRPAATLSLRPVRCTEVALGLRNRPEGVTLKNFDSRTYSVNDYVDWHRGGQLVLSPKFQRRSVWSETARSYLMDTILRGKPIPKVFIRQMIDPATGKSVREVVDGQQRLRTILSFIEDGFAIRRTHHKEYGGLYFSQLPEKPVWDSEAMRSQLIS